MDRVKRAARGIIAATPRKPARRNTGKVFAQLLPGDEFHDATGAIYVKRNELTAHHDGRPDAVVSFKRLDLVFTNPAWRAARRAPATPRKSDMTDTEAAPAPEKVEIKLNLRHLCALTRFSAKHDVRYFLEGVSLRIKNGKKILAATDGHRLGMLEYDALKSDPETLDVIIPRYVIKMAGRVLPFRRQDDLERLEMCGDRCTLFWSKTDGITFAPIDAKFPLTEGLVPTETTGETSKFNLRYLGDFAKFGEDCIGHPVFPNIKSNGLRAALVKISIFPEFTGLVMPMGDERAKDATKESA